MNVGVSMAGTALPTPLRAIVSDLDGTLLRSDGTISTYTVSTLVRLHQAGCLVAFATARPRFVATHLLARFPFRVPVIYSNGAIVSDSQGGPAVRRKTIDRQLAINIIRAVRARFPTATLAIDYVGDRTADPEWQPLGGRPVGSQLLWPIDDFALHYRPIYCIMIAGGWIDHHEVPAAWPVISTSSAHGLIELSARGANKLAALHWLCRLNGLDLQEMIAFGDMPNDLDMLTGVGLGVAMANGHPDVKAAAGAHALSNDEDGVARFLQSLNSSEGHPGSGLDVVPLVR